MAVPKCIECEFYKEGEALAMNTKSSMNGVSSLKKARYCVYFVNGAAGYPRIEANELKTSPKWCPIRTNINLSGVEK